MRGAKIFITWTRGRRLPGTRPLLTTGGRVADSALCPDEEVYLRASARMTCLEGLDAGIRVVAVLKA
jgi:hypothetical protein